MQTEIGLFEAKNKFSELADKVARTGETVIITRRGKPLVKVTPLEEARHSPKQVEEALHKLKEFGKTHPPLAGSWEELKAMIEEGRR